jgi:ABC-type dipeptide/oligopeptide/nickel transport system ATPase component
MEKGRIIEQGTVDEVYNHPKHEYTKKLINSILL